MNQDQSEQLPSFETLKAQIVEQHDSLSPRLQQVARYVLDHPRSVAFDTLAVIASAGEVHASTLVRFANALGFSGFSELQRVFRQHMMSYSPDYGERIRELRQHATADDNDSPLQLFNELSEANVLSMRHLQRTITAELLEQSLDLLDEASTLYVCGIRRAFPVTMYLVYAFNHMQVRCHSVDGMGGLFQEQTNWIGPEDLLIAVTFSPYARETRNVITRARENGARVLLITDSQLCPSWKDATLGIALQDAEVRSFRALNASLCLAQTLCISLAFRRENEQKAASDSRSGTTIANSSIVNSRDMTP